MALETFIPYLVSFGVPALIVGFGMMIYSMRLGLTLGFINFAMIYTYYLHNDKVESWVLGLILLMMSGGMLYLFNRVWGESNG